MKTMYKHVCSICKKVFFSQCRGQNICSKYCRNSIKKIKKYRKCLICGWDATIEIHHEGGKEYDFCPNHHSLLTTGKQNLEELLAGVVKQPEKPKGYICPIIDRREEDIEYCPIINGSHKVTRQLKSKINISLPSISFYHKIKELNISEFKYRELMALTRYKYSFVKKHVLNLIKIKKIEYINKISGGKGKVAIFKLL